MTLDLKGHAIILPVNVIKSRRWHEAIYKGLPVSMTAVR